MPEWVTPHSEPVSKLVVLDSMLTRLRGAIATGASESRIRKAAERVRLAQLSVIKAKLVLIREYPRRDPGGRQSENLRTEEQTWRTLSLDTIIEQYGES